MVVVKSKNFASNEQQFLTLKAHTHTHYKPSTPEKCLFSDFRGSCVCGCVYPEEEEDDDDDFLADDLATIFFYFYDKRRQPKIQYLL